MYIAEYINGYSDKIAKNTVEAASLVCRKQKVRRLWKVLRRWFLQKPLFYVMA